MKIFIVLFFCGTASFSLSAQDLSTFQKKVYIINKDTLRYRILYPAHYKPHKKYPVITFLHGSGERGSDNESQLIHGGALFLNGTLRKKYKSIVIFPQLPKDSLWENHQKVHGVTENTYDFNFSMQPTFPSLLVKSLLNSLIENKIADPRRLYIGGLSLGGMGTFDMVERYPDFFAAGFPICGGGDTSKAKAIAGKTPLWIFHGDADQSVNVKYSRDYFAALKNLGADVRYTEYPGVGHNSWDNAFAEKDLLPWLFSKKKRNGYKK